MRKVIFMVVSLAGIVATQPSLADQALAQAGGCTVCHQEATKLVGPAYKDVSARYKGDAAARDMLIAKVRKGSVGTWGEVMMPPNTVMSDADLAAVIDWILSL